MFLHVSEFSCLVVHQRCSSTGSSTGSITGSSTGTSHVQLLDESVVGSRIRLSSNDLLPSRWRSCVDAAPRLEEDQPIQAYNNITGKIGQQVVPSGSCSYSPQGQSSLVFTPNNLISKTQQVMVTTLQSQIVFL